MAIQQSTDGLRELALFAGAGGGILAGHLLGWRTICAVERDAYAAGILAQRQNDECLPPFPIWSDVTTFDGAAWRGRVDVISGGFPCQDISLAGSGEGITGERSGLWKEFARVVGEVRPRRVYVENSPALTSRGLGIVLGDLAALGLDAEWGVLGAADVGGNHERSRVWILANSDREGLQERQLQRRSEGDPRRALQRQNIALGTRWPAEPNVGRVANGVARRMDRIRAIGNGQVPRVAATAFAQLAGREWRSMTEQETILEALAAQPLTREQIQRRIGGNDLQTLRILNEMCALKLIYCNEITRQYAVLEQGPESAA
jgi:DNA (cytosine-5)-methyltransferase 1